jgi:putative DNA primase/helicase
MAQKKHAKKLILRRTDAGNAELFAVLNQEGVRYDHRRKRWLIWRKNWWVEDQTGEVLRLAKKVARSRLKRAVGMPAGSKRDEEISWACRSESVYRINAMLSLAKAEPPLADDGANWDANPLLLGVANGIVDLRTGKLREARPEDRMTLRSPVAFDPTAKCPRFERFIGEIFNGDTELVTFIRRAVGYTLTGLTDEQCFFSCHETGANGKSTLLGVLRYILGDYAVNVPFSALEKLGRSSITNDVAMLAGRRFATAIETGEDVRLNESRIKAITGGDPATARFLYRENFTFDPTQKLWLAFNHKPRIADESEGMWRRVRLIPFTRQFSGADRDNKLLDRLKAEATGILAWAVRGSLAWQKDGLGTPQVVVNATTEYREQSDHLAQFIDECCIISPGRSVSSATLWKAYLRWAEDNEEAPLSRQALTERMQKKGFKLGRSGHQGTRTWEGLALYADTLTPADTVSQDFPMGEVT